ncbi:MAG: amidohydrolase family protein [Planctomycetes bacterium]|nr:amidohydrolase family protein [Planctomycetota bacterium]
MRKLSLCSWAVILPSAFGCNLLSSPGNPATDLSAPSTTLARPTESAQPDCSVVFPPPVRGGDADVIFANGTIITMDDANPSVEAVAVQGNKILAVGRIADVFRHRGEATSVIDLEGRTLVPGFTDSHSHRIMKGIDGQYDLKSTMDESIAQGWTSLSEKYAGWDKMPRYLDLARQDNLRLRVNMYLPYNGALGEDTGDWWKVYDQDQVISPRWRIAGMKIFTGVSNDTKLLWTQDGLNALLLARHREGWHLAIKTVSTETLEMILTALENIEKTDPSIANRRVTLEHALFLTPEQIARVKRLGVIPSIQTNMPGELVGERDIEELTAREPRGSAFPWRNLVSAGVTLAGGSSFPTFYVEEPGGAPFGSPVHLMYQAVTRVGNLGTRPEAWMLDQTLTAEQALRALTINAAYANFQDDVLGSLTPGKLADMVILSDNPLAVSTPEINDIRVLMTMVDGQVEYCAPGYLPYSQP